MAHVNKIQIVALMIYYMDSAKFVMMVFIYTMDFVTLVMNPVQPGKLFFFSFSKIILKNTISFFLKKSKASNHCQTCNLGYIK